MANKRDDFTAATKELLARRVGYRCSNPDCGKITVGPGSEAGKTINIGVAAHITAAAEGGPRYDVGLTPDQRKEAANGIWLCQSCAKLIDSDVIRYPTERLYMWKSESEAKTAMELECRRTIAKVDTEIAYIRHYAAMNEKMGQNRKQHERDVEQMKFFIQCIDRPAFQSHMNGAGQIRFHGSREQMWREHDASLHDFEQAIQDTIIAINTGILRTREGDVLMRSQGKSQIKDPVWNQKMKQIAQILTGMRQSLSQRRSQGIEAVTEESYIESLENARQQVMDIINSICRDIGLNELDG